MGLNPRYRSENQLPNYRSHKYQFAQEFVLKHTVVNIALRNHTWAYYTMMCEFTLLSKTLLKPRTDSFTLRIRTAYVSFV